MLGGSSKASVPACRNGAPEVRYGVVESAKRASAAGAQKPVTSRADLGRMDARQPRVGALEVVFVVGAPCEHEQGVIIACGTVVARVPIEECRRSISPDVVDVEERENGRVSRCT